MKKYESSFSWISQLLPLIRIHFSITSAFLTVAKDCLCLMAYNVLCSSMNYCKKESLTNDQTEKKSQFENKIVLFTFQCAHYIPFDLTDLTPHFSFPPYKHFYTHEWNRKWHFPSSFVTHQSLLVCVMEKKKPQSETKVDWGAGAFECWWGCGGFGFNWYAQNWCMMASMI